MRTFCFIATAAALLCACSGNTARINGRFTGHGEKNVYLEKLLPGSQVIVDSSMTDKKGFFNFKIRFPDKNPAIYNLRCNGDVIPLILSSGEKVNVNSLCDISSNYTVSGSEGSLLMRELRDIISGGSLRLDSIINVYAAADEDTRQRIGRDYIAEYYKTKREHIKFIVTHPGTVAAIFALYQRLPNDATLFDGENDIIYYRLVADSVEARYPDSPYLKALRREIASAENSSGVANLLSEKLQSAPENYPDIELSDMYGNRHKLSSLAGKVIVLDFWSITSQQGRLNNAEYKELYSKYAGSGLDIYQVSVDESRSDWVLAVQQQRLPWITVCDFKGSASVPVLIYNIRKVPSNFLIDREGNIVEKDIYGGKLAEKIDRLLR